MNWQKKILPKLGIAAGGVIFLGAVGIISLEFLLSEEKLKAGLRSTADTFEATSVTVKGDIELRLWPRPHIVARDVTWVKENFPPFAVARGVSAPLNMAALLWGKVEVSRLELSNGLLRLDELPKTTATLPSVREVRLRGMDIVSPGLGAAPLSFKKAEGAAWITTLGALEVALSGLYAEAPTRLSITLNAPRALTSAKGSAVTASFEHPSLTATYRGHYGIASGLNVDGTITAKASRTSSALGLLKLDAGFEAATFPLVMTATLKGKNRTYQMSAINAQSGKSQAEGALSLNMEPERPTIQGTLAFDNLILPDPLILASPTRGSGATVLSNLTALAQPAFRLPRAFDADIRLSANNLTAGRLSLEKVAGGVNLKDHALLMQIGEARWGEGTLKGKIALEDKLSLRETVPLMSINVQGEKIALGQLSQWLLNVRGIEATSAVNASLTMRGTTLAAMLNNLSGDVAITAVNGYVSGVSLATSLLQLEKTPQVEMISPQLSAQTAFDHLNVTLKVRGQTAEVVDTTLFNKGEKYIINGQWQWPQNTASLMLLLPQKDQPVDQAKKIELMIDEAKIALREKKS